MQSSTELIFLHDFISNLWSSLFSLTLLNNFRKNKSFGGSFSLAAKEARLAAMLAF
jgi:hypothetical protein